MPSVFHITSAAAPADSLPAIEGSLLVKRLVTKMEGWGQVQSGVMKLMTTYDSVHCVAKRCL